MTKPLKILMLEDNATDAEIVQRMLLKGNLFFEFRLAIDKETYLEALDKFQPDIILSDHSLPQFNSTNALAAAREKFPDIPFIMVTGAVSEEFAANIIKFGANDYILKDRLNRLPVAIDTALKQKKAENEKRETEKRIMQSEANLRTIFENTSEGFLLMDSNGIVKAFNSKAREYFFFSSKKELQTGQSIYDFIEEKRNLFFKEVISKVLTGESVQYDRSYEMENGNSRWIDFSVTPVIEAGQVTGVCVTGRDITEHKKADESLKTMEQEILNQKIQEQKKITRAIIKAQERERNHIGQELHDNVNQILAGTKLYLGMAGKDARMKELVKYPMELIDKTISEIRLLSSKNVTPLKNINLKELLQLLLDNLDASTTIKIVFVYEEIDKTIEDELKLNIYRLIQEQLNNILKHAEAQNVSVSLKADDHIINIIVTDDGKGFDVKKKRKGIGISNMMNRIESFNGEAEIISSSGKGCKIKIKIPY